MTGDSSAEMIGTREGTYQIEVTATDAGGAAGKKVIALNLGRGVRVRNIDLSAAAYDQKLDRVGLATAYAGVAIYNPVGSVLDQHAIDPPLGPEPGPVSISADGMRAVIKDNGTQFIVVDLAPFDVVADVQLPLGTTAAVVGDWLYYGVLNELHRRHLDTGADETLAGVSQGPVFLDPRGRYVYRLESSSASRWDLSQEPPALGRGGRPALNVGASGRCGRGSR